MSEPKKERDVQTRGPATAPPGRGVTGASERSERAPTRKKKREKPEVLFLKAVVFVNALVPLGMLAFDWWRDRLGANPIEFVTRTTGTLTLVFLILTLAVTPARRFFDAPMIARLRRMLGLFAFFYGTLHLLTYVALDKFFSLKGIVEDVLGRYFISVGMIAYFAMIALAVTSTDGWAKKLGGARWRQIHKRIYWIVPLGVLHYILLVKADLQKPIIFGALTAALLGVRAIRYLRTPDAKAKAGSE